MKFVIQRVRHAEVAVDGECIGKIGHGLLVLIGISDSDTAQIADKMVRKLIGLRIFDDENGKTNLDLKSVNGELLLISQFTLYADCRKGNRPSFIKAGKPDMANELYEYIIGECRREIPVVEHGRFGADMKVSLLNDGPFTIVLDSDEILPQEQG
ncbi:MAG: D-aminoacyl-tRNA deacylase [Butyrivibrio sp.]